MKVSLLFRLNRFIYFLFRGIGKLETEHFLFALREPLDDFNLYRMLAGHNFHPNYFGYVYRGQVYQCRQLVDQGMHQYHLRFYEKGGKIDVSAHFEIAPEWDLSDHLSGVDLRDLIEPETEKLKRILNG